LYDPENRFIKALQKMAEAALSAELRQGFESHLEQTKHHALRLEQIFERMGEEPKRKKCAAVVGPIPEGDDLMGEDYEGGVQDAALISATQRVEDHGNGGQIDSKAVLGQAFEAAKTFSNVAKEDLTAMLEKTNPAASDGMFEPFKTSPIFDSTGPSRMARLQPSDMSANMGNIRALLEGGVKRNHDVNGSNRTAFQKKRTGERVRFGSDVLRNR
jgi:hypothetical protein